MHQAMFGLDLARIKITKAKQIGELVKQVRKFKGLTQEELAGVSNTGTRFISDLENGKETCELQKVLHVINMLDIKIKLEPAGQKKL